GSSIGPRSAAACSAATRKPPKTHSPKRTTQRVPAAAYGWELYWCLGEDPVKELQVLQKTDTLHQARWWETEADGRVHCYLCPRHCHIRPGQAGFCFIRVNEGGKLYSLGYGSPAALQIDPIEKKPLNHFLPATRIFTMGTPRCNIA